ncbi:MAG: helix-turn-helix transcriptional regulator [Lachnospiraceae bacterium]|nr:helix-turn-helix transcriptional regulator [Lachnospiraceae bacterium]
MDIGNKIRELRMQIGLTQEELADRSELSKGFISQVERNLTSPSIATLTDILQVLGTDLEGFFRNTSERQVVFTKEDYFEKIEEELGSTIEWIVPNAQKNEMEPILVTLTGEGKTYSYPPHEGEEFGYVLSGTIRIVCGKHSYKARKGESFYLAPSEEHYIESASKTGAKFLWVCTPPSF